MDTNNKHCLNCNNEINGNYCSHCGQSADTFRVGTNNIVEELQYGLLHINKGLLYTIKELILRPGITVRNYISGKRVKYTKPFLFLIIAGVIYSLVFHFFHYFPMEEMNSHTTPVFDYIPLYKWYSEHYSLVLLCLIPFYTLFTYWLFRGKGYNYVEHLVLFSYLTGGKIFLLLLSFPVIYLTRSVHVYQAVQIVSEIYLIWGLARFFQSASWLKAVPKVILSLILALIVMIILIYCVFLVLSSFDVRL
ncbi:MAG: DUF3667 domain-containing protein [Prevotella sp.]|jgi:hypothetical protein|nr:DUF3667 domain-containing protein [Prevotella sp.]